MEDLVVHTNVMEADESTHHRTSKPIAVSKINSSLRSRNSPPSVGENLMSIITEQSKTNDSDSGGKRTESLPLDPSDFECSLCFRLFCRPITSACGHTYCKNCLFESLKYSLMCPLCRKELPKPSNQLNQYSVNIVLSNVLEKHFNEEYLSRIEEDEEEEREMHKAQEHQTASVESEEIGYLGWADCFTPVRETCKILLSCTQVEVGRIEGL
eukprot:TRINITY_DN20057_c0_g1_i1.p1 TRINITY_DN20057_c0_g1~~TRINITY_DN20057_c0_g1_i1.p1  ORF type:complete len:212 (-),score=32.08 TRINITY_DN20057_c0_g1_i1:45-680(-)